MRFGKTFKKLRVQSGISMCAAAKKAGLHKSILSKWENGMQDILLENAMKAFRAIGHEIRPTRF